jgi:hypothetical protein
MKKTIMFAFIGLLLVVGLVSAYKGDNSIKGPEYSEERCSLMQETFENLDYNSWKEIMSENSRKGKILEVINEDNFEIFVEMHQAKINSDFEKVNELRQELGLNNGLGLKNDEGFKQGNDFGKMRQSGEKRGLGKQHFRN